MCCIYLVLSFVSGHDHCVHDVILMSCIFLVLCACAIESVCPRVLSVNISLFGVLNKSK